jgi:predicted nucleic acid-binding protein
MRIFLDANVLFSAAKSNGAVRELLVRLRGEGHVLCADEYVLAEARRNLEKKGAEALADLVKLGREIDLAPFRQTTLPESAAAALPEKDRPVLAAAIRLRCDALMTGDRTHFGKLYGTTIEGVMIHSPRSLAESVLG